MIPHARAALEQPLAAEPRTSSDGVDVLHGVRLGINAIPILSPMAGVGQYTYHLIHQLQQLLPQAPWLFYGTSWERGIRTSAAPAARKLNIAIKRYLPRPEMLIRLMRQGRFTAGANAHSIDLYHEPAFMAYRFRGPSVVTVHDISWVRHPETHPVERVREMNRVMPGVVRHANQIVVDSNFVRQEVISHYGVVPERVTTVPLGVSPDFRPLEATQCAPVLSRFGVRHGEYILAVGTLEPRKNLTTALAAYTRLPEAFRRRYPLVVAGMNGWGMEGLSGSLKAMIARGEVRLTGYVPQQDLPALYSGARTLVYPSLYEGFGLPPLEAMACGTPAIVSRRASLPEVVGDAGVLVEPLDDQAIAQHMQQLAEDDAMHARLAEAGRLHARQFTWRKFALDMLAVYRQALS